MTSFWLFGTGAIGFCIPIVFACNAKALSIGGTDSTNHVPNYFKTWGYQNVVIGVTSETSERTNIVFNI